MSAVEKKVLVIGTSHKTRGGITTVINSYKDSYLWEKYHCQWIETHIDKHPIIKLLYCIKAYIQFIFIFYLYDIIHFHVSEITTVRRKYPLFKIAKFFKKKTIIHFHNNHFLMKSHDKDKQFKLYKKFFSQADLIIVVSDYWKVWLLDNFKLKNNVVIVYNAAPEIPQENSRIDKKEKYILFAGVITKMKGCYDLIKAFSSICHKHNDWHIEFAGTGEEKEIINYAHSLNIPPNQIHFNGWVTGEKKNNIFRNASVFCLPSYGEGFPMVILEAWMHHLPIISTYVGGIPDMVNSNNGLLFKPGDTKQLSKYLELLINNKNTRLELAENGFKTATEKFSKKGIIDTIDKIYTSI